MTDHQPNIIFIMPDQLRADFLSCYGAPFIRTPHIDSIAAQGVRYERAYTTSPICVPARASLLTGLNAIRTGVLDNGQWLRPDLAACGIHTWPELLAQQGYYTAAVGKMHFYPWDMRHGFQYRAIAEDKRWLHIRDDYYHFLRQHGERKYHGKEHAGYYAQRGAIVNRLPWELSVDHFVGTEACRFLRTYGDERPFAMMIGFPGPHCPYDPNAEFLEQIDPAQMPPAIPAAPGVTPKLRQANIDGNRQPWNGVDYTEFTAAHKQKIRAHYAASVLQIDYEVGQILEALAKQGLLDNTVIIFASDHGDYLGDHDLIGKGSYYESSIHVPLIVRLPGSAAAETYSGLVALGDIMPTIVGLAGCEIPPTLDFRLLPGLMQTDETARPELIGLLASGWMVYNGRWKLCKYASGEQVLFDLASDPLEQVNRIDDPAAVTVYRELDIHLTQEVMRAVNLANHDRRVYTRDLSGDADFGKEGWQRPYPRRLEELNAS